MTNPNPEDDPIPIRVTAAHSWDCPFRQRGSTCTCGAWRDDPGYPDVTQIHDHVYEGNDE